MRFWKNNKKKKFFGKFKMI